MTPIVINFLLVSPSFELQDLSGMMMAIIDEGFFFLHSVLKLFSCAPIELKIFYELSIPVEAYFY